MSQPNVRGTQATGDEGTSPLIEVDGLTKRFPVSKNLFRKPTGFIHAVDDVSFQLARGENLGVVGESGCGKTTIGKLLVRLLEPNEGRILFPTARRRRRRGPDRHFGTKEQGDEGVPPPRPDDFPGPV